MSDLKIGIKVDGGDQAANDLKKVADSTQKITEPTKQASDAVDKLSQNKNKLAESLKRAAQGFPILGNAIDAIRNPFMLLTVAIGGLIALKDKLRERLAELPSLFGNAGRAATAQSGNLSDYATAIKKIADGMDDLKKATEGMTSSLQRDIERGGENKKAIIAMAEAQAELDKLNLDRDEADPVRRAAGKAKIDKHLAEVKLGLAGTAGQKADLIDEQIQREKSLQADLQGEIPSAEIVGAAVADFQSAQASLQSATTANRQRFARREALNMALREKGTYDFSPEDYSYLREIGVIEDGGRINKERAAQFLPAEEAGLKLSRDRLSTAQGAFNSARRSLPPGVATEADIEPYVTGAQAAAAKLQNESYSREQDLVLQRQRLMRDQTLEIGLSKVNVQKVETQGQIAVQAASERAAAQMQRGEAINLGERAGNITADVLEGFTRSFESRISNLERQSRMNSQNLR